MTNDGTREWGPWSVWKTEILLGGYLSLFVRASAKAPHRTFIDCFAGVSENVERFTGRSLKSSPQLALGVTPEFSHLLAFELPGKAARLERALRTEFPGRAVHVVEGDCNAEIGNGLQWWFEQRHGQKGPYLGPTLAYLDPNSLELAWSTIETIARFGMTPPAPGAWVRKKGPIELLILFPTGPLKRSLPQKGKSPAAPSTCEKIDRLFGTDAWRVIYEDQREGRLGGEPSWGHYVNLYRLQLVGLGYTDTSAIEVRSTAGVVIYHMVFATAHVAGKRIMSAVMDRAREILPAMLEEEKRKIATKTQDSLAIQFEGWAAEFEAISVDPSKYASLITGEPVPYSGMVGAPRDEQLELF